MNITSFFNQLWQDYIQLAPEAKTIVDHFSTSDRPVINDHVAFRTFGSSPLSLENLEPLIFSLGFKATGQYRFEQKKLHARSYQHTDPSVPKIFLSQLCVEELSDSSQQVLAKYTDQILESKALDESVFWSGRSWTMPSWHDYQTLLEESEYAAWLCTLGLRANHFTLSVNDLSPIPSLSDVLAEVKSMGFKINQSGGEIKGSPDILLEQGSTLASSQMFTFAGGEQHIIPTCFYEFARRYPDQSGQVFQGFVEGNADKIFDATHAL